MKRDIDSYDEELDDVDPGLASEHQKRTAPRAWCRTEAREVADFLVAYVDRQLESGAAVQPIIRLVAAVRTVILAAAGLE